MRENPLREWRHARSLTALDVALKLDVSEQTIYSYELGRFEPSSDKVDQLAVLMSLSPSQFRLAWHFWKTTKANGTS